MFRNVRQSSRETDFQPEEGKERSAGKCALAKQTEKEDQAGGMKCIERF